MRGTATSWNSSSRLDIHKKNQQGDEFREPAWTAAKCYTKRSESGEPNHASSKWTEITWLASVCTLSKGHKVEHSSNLLTLETHLISFPIWQLCNNHPAFHYCHWLGFLRVSNRMVNTKSRQEQQATDPIAIQHAIAAIEEPCSWLMKISETAIEHADTSMARHCIVIDLPFDSLSAKLLLME